MSSAYIAVRLAYQMISEYTHHPRFIEELDNFIGNHCAGTASVERTLNNIEKLLATHFNNYEAITKKHIGQAQGFEGYNVYWLHLAIPDSGLSRTKNPKCYMLVHKKVLSFLCMDSHINNYKDSELRETAKVRLAEMQKVIGESGQG